MPTHTLTLDGFTPTLLNRVRGRHWSREHRAKKLDGAVYAAEALAQGVPRATGRRRLRATVSGWARGGRLPDADAPLKVLLDSLVRAGLLLDDGPGGLEGMPVVEFARGPKRTVIVLEDCDG